MYCASDPDTLLTAVQVNNLAPKYLLTPPKLHKNHRCYSIAFQEEKL